MDVISIQQKLDLSIEEIDKLTGPVIGHPKSATFRTADVVGIDTLVKVADGLNNALGKQVLEVPDFIRKMCENNWLGDKTNQGFFIKKVNEKGEKEYWALNTKTLEYQPPSRAKFATLEATKSIETLAKRWAVLVNGADVAGEFYRQMFGGLFWYSSSCIPEIANEIYKLDNAMVAGFGWEAGPFQTWDQLGFQHGIELIKKNGREIPEWVIQLSKQPNPSFYKIENGVKLYWDIVVNKYEPVSKTGSAIILNDLRGKKPVFQNAGSTLHHLGDDILCLEFHTKMNTLGSEVIEGLQRAFDIAEKSYNGLIIGNQGQNFSAGANLGLVLMYAIEQEFEEIDFMIRQFQQTVMRVRYSSIPVVVAPHGLSLGGGCEMAMHADRIQASAETYMGLVETGVGVIPGGGGTKEMALRVSQKIEMGDTELNSLQNAFMNIATAKVSSSAQETFDMGIMQHGDRISVNKNNVISDAKKLVLELVGGGYSKPIPKNIRVQGRGGIATFQAGIYAMKAAGKISAHDQKVVEKLSFVINGGDLSYPQMVSEQYLLDLEREAFLSLTGERKTLERIQSLLSGGKVIRN